MLKSKAFFIFAVLFLLFTTCARANSISWYYSYTEGMAAAQKYDKPVMMDVFIQGCHFCDRLNNETFTDQGVIDLSKKFICIKVDADKDPSVARPVQNRFLYNSLAVCCEAAKKYL